MNTTDNVAVCSRSFSRHPILRAEILSRFANVTFNETGLQLEGPELIDFLKGHNKAITAMETIDEALLSALPELQVIGKYGVGLDMIDFDAMRRHGKRLGSVSGVNRRSAAELTLAFAIVMLRHVVAGNREILAGGWRQLMGGQLSGRTVGIIGCGNIGKDLVHLLQPFQCSILINDIRHYPEFYSKFNLQQVSKEELLTRADVVSLHVPLDDSTRNMLTAERLSLMKPTAILINAARGGLVDEVFLKEMLKEKRLAAAAFDVFVQEPPKDYELLELPNFLATPHIGGSAEEAIIAMGLAAIDGLDNGEVPTK
jgi:phosphoglycerate dehydrogenase-like enzyme